MIGKSISAYVRRTLAAVPTDPARFTATSIHIQMEGSNAGARTVFLDVRDDRGHVNWTVMVSFEAKQATLRFGNGTFGGGASLIFDLPAAQRRAALKVATLAVEALGASAEGWEASPISFGAQAWHRTRNV